MDTTCLNDFVPGGSDDPRKFKDAKGRIVIIGPALPAGKKISGHERAKVEVFRGLLRPFVTTVNQELSDVLKSNIRVFLILPGTVDGKEPNNENIVNTINYLVSDEAAIKFGSNFLPRRDKIVLENTSRIYNQLNCCCDKHNDYYNLQFVFLYLKGQSST